jgi:hypothetical protein
MKVPPSNCIVAATASGGDVITSFAELRGGVVAALALTRWPLVANLRRNNRDPLNARVAP